MNNDKITVSQVGNMVTLTQGAITRQMHMNCTGKAMRLASKLRKTESTRRATFDSWGAGDE